MNERNICQTITLTQKYCRKKLVKKETMNSMNGNDLANNHVWQPTLAPELHLQSSTELREAYPTQRTTRPVYHPNNNASRTQSVIQLLTHRSHKYTSTEFINLIVIISRLHHILLQKLFRGYSLSQQISSYYEVKFIKQSAEMYNFQFLSIPVFSCSFPRLYHAVMIHVLVHAVKYDDENPRKSLHKKLPYCTYG